MNIVNLLQQARQVQSNPSQLRQILYQSGLVNKEQFSALKGMTPTEIGNYVSQNNIIPSSKLGALQQQAAQIQNLMK